MHLQIALSIADFSMNSLARFLLVLLCGLFVPSVSALAEDQVSRFGFQEVLLNMPFANIPSDFKSDCGSGKDRRFIFCTYKTLAGVVSMTVGITITDARVSEIHVYFPSTDFDAVWLALRQKYGQEDKRDSQAVEWYSNAMQPEKPIPDELLLQRKPEEPPKADGIYFIAGTNYSLMHFKSYAIARDVVKRRTEDLNRKIKGIADGL